MVRVDARTTWRADPKGKLDFGPWEQMVYGEFDSH
jgi:hypothetical protein